MLSDALTKAAQSAEYKAFIEAQFADPASYVAADAANAYLKSQLDEMKSLIGTK